MRLTTAVFLVCAGAVLCALSSAPALAMPYVVQPMGAGGSGTQVIVDELEQESVQYKQRVDLDGGVLDGPGMNDEEPGLLLEEDVEIDIEMDDGSPPPQPRCRLRACWKSCQRRGYNWGLCLCKKCRCYY